MKSSKFTPRRISWKGSQPQTTQKSFSRWVFPQIVTSSEILRTFVGHKQLFLQEFIDTVESRYLKHALSRTS